MTGKFFELIVPNNGEMKQKPASITTATTLGIASLVSFWPMATTAKTQLENKENRDDSGYLTFFLDNDLFSGTDQNYTNGARLSWISEGRPAIEIPWLEDWLHCFCGGDDTYQPLRAIWGFEDANKVEYSYGFSLSQLMFTPEDPEAIIPPPGDRPYAGWLGLGFSLHVRDERVLNSVELSLGIVGPYAYGEEAQDVIHDFWRIDKFDGWDSQLPTEVTLNLFFNQRRRWSDLAKCSLPCGLEMDGFHETGYAIGNYKTEAHAGFLIRVGWNLPLEFSDTRLSPTAHTQKLYTNGQHNKQRWSFYSVFGARASGVLHDITLDGPLFRHVETGVKREPWLGELYAGFGVRCGDWEFSYVHTYRTKQFKSQDGGNSFGSIAIRTHF